MLAPDLRCEVGKLKTVASYTSCRLKADAKGLTKGLSPDYGSCESRILSKFPRLEDQAGPGVCPSGMDVADIKDRADDFETSIAVLLSGGSLPATECGDGIIDLGEQCDVGNLDGETCASRGYFNGTLACAPGCSFDESGCNATRFEDNGNTILDHQTELEWEKKGSSDGVANLADPHDVDNTYTWCSGGGCTTMIGTLFTSFLKALNGSTDAATHVTSGCFENHCDWRVPTIDELVSIAVASCGSAPCIADALFVPTRSGGYWSISSHPSVPTGAFFLEFTTGIAAGNVKTTSYSARAVRSTE